MSGWIVILLLLVHGAAAAAPPAGTPWPTGTQPRPQVPAPTTGSVSVRVYEGFGSLGPLYGHRDGAVGVDVMAELSACTDGSQVVTALRIGGIRYPLDATCPGARPAAAPQRPGIRCSASTWDCRTR